MTYQQLRIDIKTDDGIDKEMYDAICEAIEEHGGEVMDDGHAPYTEDVSYFYADKN
jgi:hypothetical protein